MTTSAPHGSAILISSFDENEFRGCLERERDFFRYRHQKNRIVTRERNFLIVYKVRKTQNVEDVSRGSAI